MSQDKKSNDAVQTPQDLFLRLDDDESELDYSYTPSGGDFELVLPIDDNEEPEEEIEVLVPDNTLDKKEKKEKREKARKEKKQEKDTAKKEGSQKPIPGSKGIKTVLVIVVLLALLAAACYFAGPIIKQRKLEEKQAATQALINEIFGNNAKYEYTDSSAAGVDELYTVSADNLSHPLGYCAIVSPDGKYGEIDMAVGISFSKTVVGIKVILHSEDENRGGGVLSSEYLSNYIGLWGDNIPFEEDINAVSGATITSKAVNEGINCALACYEEVFGEDVLSSFQKPGTLSFGDAVYDFFGWIYDEHKILNTDPITHPFDNMYALSVETANGESYVGYGAQVSVSAGGGSAELLIGIYYDTILGVEFLDYEGPGFEKLALDGAYLDLFKTDREKPADPEYGVTIPMYPELDEEARAVTEKVSEALDFYPEFFSLYNTQNTTEAEE